MTVSQIRPLHTSSKSPAWERLTAFLEERRGATEPAADLEAFERGHKSPALLAGPKGKGNTSLGQPEDGGNSCEPAPACSAGD
jgi:hypothetical protein